MNLQLDQRLLTIRTSPDRSCTGRTRSGATANQLEDAGPGKVTEWGRRCYSPVSTGTTCRPIKYNAIKECFLFFLFYSFFLGIINKCIHCLFASSIQLLSISLLLFWMLSPWMWTENIIISHKVLPASGQDMVSLPAGSELDWNGFRRLIKLYFKWNLCSGRSQLLF